ncbi:MAG: hypothetical protein LBQ47_09010 [Endomicrobium sp.]|jgi:hypothetical protein|nr:hypothetical protein [Endomicrobium sp.]
MNFRQKLERERAGNILFPQMRLGIFCHYTPEEQAELDKIKKEAELSAAKVKELEEKLKTNPPAPNPPNPQTKTLEEQEEENRKQKEKIDAENKKIERAVEFNFSVEKFAAENIDILGEETKNIIELAKGRTYANSIEKANELRASIISKFFSAQENIDALQTDKMKGKAAEFLGFAQVKKNETSAEHWDLLELAVANLKKDKKHEELLKGEKGIETNDFQKKYKERLTEKTINYYNHPRRAF